MLVSPSDLADDGVDLADLNHDALERFAGLGDQLDARSAGVADAVMRPVRKPRLLSVASGSHLRGDDGKAATGVGRPSGC